jgi:lysophospholipase L1-like esterase
MKLPAGSEYVALGSSFAAGAGIGDRESGSPRRAGRSTHNYAHVLADRLRLRLTDASFSGATIAQIVGRERGLTASPQVDAVGPDTRLVTLTAGGNDLGYVGYLIGSSLSPIMRTLTGGTRRLRSLSDEKELERKAALLGDDVLELFDGIRQRAPQATIAVTDYLAVLPADAAIGSDPLDRDHADRGRAIADRLTLTLRQAAARADVMFVEVSGASASHHAWSFDPWTERYVWIGGKAAPYHPTPAGMQFVADAIQGALANA